MRGAVARVCGFRRLALVGLVGLPLGFVVDLSAAVLLLALVLDGVDAFLVLAGIGNSAAVVPLPTRGILTLLTPQING